MALEFRGDPPREVLLVGAIPGTVDHLIGMTPPVRAAVPLAGGGGREGAGTARASAGPGASRRVSPTSGGSGGELAPGGAHR